MRKRAPRSEHPSAMREALPTFNRILAMIPDALLVRLQEQWDRVRLRRGELVPVTGAISSLYFPLTCVVSMQTNGPEGVTSQVALIGPDGLVGIEALGSGEPSPLSYVVIGEGVALRISAAAVLKELTSEENGLFRRVLWRCALALLHQSAQRGLCGRHHSPQQQLAVLLLLAQDQWSTRSMEMTHELIANMLGLRRETVTHAAHALQSSSVLDYRRGHITVLDRGALLHAACECYAVIAKEVSLPEGASFLGIAPRVNS